MHDIAVPWLEHYQGDIALGPIHREGGEGGGLE